VRRNPKPFFGYSDLTTVVNAIYAKTGNESYLYQVRCLVWENKLRQIADFTSSLFYEKDDLYRINWDFIRGTAISGVVVGGNIRCFLKLAGTHYMPDLKGKVLFLESYAGGAARMTSYLTQLRHMGVFDEISGLLLGTFTRMEEKQERPDIVELALQVTGGRDFPIAKTSDVGHANTSKCLRIGREYTIQSNV
jgi:muramoyltetrapeptide carboxypeptidase LdcA involved in peptidoglycan recycling